MPIWVKLWMQQLRNRVAYMHSNVREVMLSAKISLHLCCEPVEGWVICIEMVMWNHFIFYFGMHLWDFGWSNPLGMPLLERNLFFQQSLIILE